jgi:hypothetical protein
MRSPPGGQLGDVPRYRMRKILWAAALSLGLAASANADTSANDKKGKVKTGGACKADGDCDQSSRAQRCRDSKCEPMPTHPVT